MSDTGDSQITFWTMKSPRGKHKTPLQGVTWKTSNIYNNGVYLKRLTYTRTVAEGAKYDFDFCNITHPVVELTNLYL